MASVHTHFFRWADLAIEVRYCPDWSACYAAVYGHALARIEVIAAGRAPLPISATGYRSHFDRVDTIEASGGPVTFVQEWLDHAALLPEWTARKVARGQLLLL